MRAWKEKAMYPSYAIIFWIIIGATVGLVATKMMDPPRRASGNVAVGVLSSIGAGLITRLLFGLTAGGVAVLTSLIVAGLGATAMVALFRSLAGTRTVP
jgi:uncharacterized membrane protein YeaQ/YmgE (transglycosylase-associated protein family)